MSHSHQHTNEAEWRFCPYCGSSLIDKRAHGRMRRYCQACQRVIFKEHKVAVAMLLWDDIYKVLLVRRAWKPMQGYWSLPAGFVDFDEDPIQAVIRECYEETGLETEVIGLLDVVAGREHARGADIIIVYQGQITGGALLAADDATEVGFFALDALPPLAFKSTHQAIEHIQMLCQEVT